MDIYSRLKDDHGKQRGLAAGHADTTGDSAERRRLFEELAKEIKAHAAAEEQTFYKELIGLADGQQTARHSVSEHTEAADLLEKLTETDFASASWLSTFKKLKEDLEHHMDEEETAVFEVAKSLIDRTDAEKLAAEFERRKRQAM